MTATNTCRTLWSFEVVKGNVPGRRYPIDTQEIVLGNALDGCVGIDLADQEGSAPRRMAGRQARLFSVAEGLSIVDLQSPGGTFVNRERLQPGIKRELHPNDLIQLGPVQLRVLQENPTAPAPASSFPYVFQNGAICRSWDDFLTLSAQRWNDLRDEMTSGRLAGFLASMGRRDLAPDPHASGTPDERLDSWIGSLPTTRKATPELDVHPRSLVIRSGKGGGTTRRKIQINNTGYRMLRVRARLEPAPCTWLRIVGDNSSPLVTIDSVELVLEADLPETLTARKICHLVLESNGGTSRIDIVLDPDHPSPPLDVPRTAAIGSSVFVDRVQKISFVRRAALAAFVLVVIKVILGASHSLVPSLLIGGQLGAIAIPLCALFGLLALGITLRWGSPRDLPWTGLTGVILGVMTSSLIEALDRVLLPITRGSSVGVGLSWAILGGLAACLSLWLIPFKNPSSEIPR